MQNSENFSSPTKATSGRPAYSPALYQIQSAIAKLLVSFRCQVKIRKVKPGKQRGATVAVCDDGGRVMVKEWNRDRISRLRPEVEEMQKIVRLIARLIIARHECTHVRHCKENAPIYMYYVAPETPMMSSVIADCLALVPPPNIMDKSTPMEKPLTFISFLHRPSGTVMELHVGHQVRKGVVSREKPETALAWFVAASSDLVTRKSLQWYYARFG